VRKIFDLDFCIAQILLLISVVIEINQKEYWGAYMTLLLAVMILVYQVTAVRCDYWREACYKALRDLGFYKAKAEHLEYLQKMKDKNNENDQ
jgi:hypothetical protein